MRAARTRSPCCSSDLPARSQSPASEVRKALRELKKHRPATTDSGEHTYDALIEAASRLSPSAFGDSILLFGHDEDSGSQASPDQVQELLLRRGLRLYGFSFTTPASIRGKTFDPNKPVPKEWGPSRLARLAGVTGFPFSFHSLEVLAIKGQIPLLESFLADVYRGIAEPYRIELKASTIPSPGALKIEVNGAKERGIVARDVRYPQSIYPCAGTQVGAR